jgi:transposase
MEGCSGAHHWARKLKAMGIDARIIAAHSVEPYRMQGKSGKNDANDAAAVCEAASRPMMHFIAIKTVQQQCILSVHRLREVLKAERTACINRIRGLLTEFGLVFAQTSKVLREVLTEVIEDASNEIAGLARLVIERAQTQWKELDDRPPRSDQETWLNFGQNLGGGLLFREKISYKSIYYIFRNG